MGKDKVPEQVEMSEDERKYLEAQARQAEERGRQAAMDKLLQDLEEA